MESDKIAEFETRIKALEEYISKIEFNDTKEITMTDCPIENLLVKSDLGNMKLYNCDIQSIRYGDIAQ